MLRFVENQLQEAQTPEIWETEVEKALPIGDLKKKYIYLAHERFIRTPPVVVLNKDKNWPIELSGRVIGEWRLKSRTRERIIAIQVLNTMIEGAKFLKTVEDAKSTRGIESVSYFENSCKINGKLFRINITVKKQQVVDRRFAYYYAASEFEIKK
jgi:hypothetical protein